MLLRNSVEIANDLISSATTENFVINRNICELFESECNLLCASYIYFYLFSRLEDVSYKNKISIFELKNSLGILPEFNNFFDFMLNILIDMQWLSYRSEYIEVLIDSTKVPHPLSLMHRLKDDFPEFMGSCNLLQHCVSHYNKALSGGIPPLSVLYPGGDIGFFDSMISENKLEYSCMPIMCQLLSSVICQLNQKKTLNILEIGGGRGLFTRKILSKLSIDQCSYHFTDISRKFVLDMKRQFSYIRCSQFDITQCPISQGLEKSSYDIILGLDVVHVVKTIPEALKNLRTLLSDDGFFCLLETTKAPLWLNMIMGLTKDWWLFDDKWRAQSPLLSEDKWKDVLKYIGFERIYPINLFAQKNINTDSTLIMFS